MKRSLIFLIIVALLGGGAFLAGRKLSKPEEITPPLKAKPGIERKSILKTRPAMRKIDTDGDGIPDTFVMEGEPRSLPATPKRIPERIPEGLIVAYCYDVCDGDTIEVKLRNGTKEKVRLVGIDTYETTEGKRLQRQADKAGVSIEEAKKLGLEAKKYVMERYLKKTVFLDIDDESPVGYYGRTLALVYLPSIKNKIPQNSLNAKLLQQGYADILYIPPSEFDPDSW